tara:strand:+ start:602 stop:1378 length:777 start_codon:yes stop_codon:yes gene_type:complete
MAKSLINSIISKLTDDEGLFQGGEQGRAFGRIRDLFGGGDAHDVIDREISSGSRIQDLPERKKRNYMQEANMNAIRQKFTEPSRFVEILKSMHPDIEDTWEEAGNPPLKEYEEGLGSWDYERRAADWNRALPFYQHTRQAEPAFEVDDLLRAILGQQYGEHTEEKPYRTSRPGRSRYWTMSDLYDDYHEGGMSRTMKIDPDTTLPKKEMWHEGINEMVEDPRYGDALIPQDITDIIKLIQGLPSEYDEWIDERWGRIE